MNRKRIIANNFKHYNTYKKNIVTKPQIREGIKIIEKNEKSFKIMIKC